MERRDHTGQQEKLVEVRMDVDTSADAVRQSRAPSPASFRCLVALATAMGLVIVVLVAGFVLHHFTYTPSCSQDAPAVTAKVIRRHALKKTGQEGTYDLFTVDKAAKYLVYGWLKLSEIAKEDVELVQTFQGDKRVIERKKAEKGDMFFLKRRLLVNNSTVSIHFRSAYEDALFHVYEL